MTTISLARLPLLAAAAALVAVSMAGCPNEVAAPCAGDRCAPPADDRAPRFFADPPFGVGFDCVTLGCDTEKSLVVENRGGGKLGVSLVRPTLDTSSDFSIRRKDGEGLPRPDLQVFLGAGEKLELVVRYVPSDGIVDTGAVQFESYDAAVAYEDSAPVKNEVPLTARVFGTPAAALPFATLDFGYVPVGETVSLDLIVENGGSESVLRVGPAALEDDAATAFHPTSPDDWRERFANPGAPAVLPVSFTPDIADAFFGVLLVQTNDPDAPTLRVELQGTAIAEPRLAVVSPVGELVLPSVRVNNIRTGFVVVKNLGGQPLDVNAAMTAGTQFGLAVSPADVAQIPPLAAVSFEVVLIAQSGGPVTGALTLTSNDPSAPGGTLVNIRGDVEAPLLLSTPGSVDFGDIVQGWIAEPRTIAISNTGFGELTVTSVAFDVGSSSQIQLIEVPPLPVKLSPGEEPIRITALMTAQNIGPVDAVLLVGSDSVTGDIARIPLHGDVITCQEGCPTANGTPSCSSGRCEVGTCFQGFHDADDRATNGCECQEDVVGNTVRDIPGACPGLDLGTLSDDNTSGIIRSGTLHSLSDVDLYFIRMKDDTQFLNDKYGGEVTLLSGPPGLQICANFQQKGTGCGGLPTRCGTGRIRGNGQSGIFGSSDNSEDVTVFVNWAPGSNPVCGTYSIKFFARGNF
jgi:hypothetical protein